MFKIIFIIFYISFYTNSFIFNNRILSKNTIQQIKYTLGGRILKKIKNRISNKAEIPIISKKVIKISPGGLNAFYILGVCSYIKNNYYLDNYVFSGASAGAWNSLYMCFKGNDSDFINSVFNLEYENVTSVLELQHLIKQNILHKFDYNDFDFSKLYIGVTIFEKFRFYNTIFYTFETLEDAIDCCIASSHIPLITGGFFNIYKNRYTFDGGFSLNPYVNKNETLFISYNIWNKEKNHDFDLNTFNITDYNFTKSYYDGYNDTLNKSKILDDIFN